MNGLILPIGGVASERVSASSLHSRLIFCHLEEFLALILGGVREGGGEDK